jgi:hypothetical protein
MTGKGTQQSKPKVAGLDEINVPTSETDVPAPCFAGTRALNVSWIMEPVIAYTKPSENSGKGK